MKRLILILLVFVAFGVKAQNYTLSKYKVMTLQEPRLDEDDNLVYDSIIYWCISEDTKLARKQIRFVYKKERYANDTLVPANKTYPRHLIFVINKNNYILKNGIKYNQDTIFHLMRFGDWKVNRKMVGRKLIKGKLK